MREIKFRAWDKKKRAMLWDDDFVISEGKPVSVFGGEIDFRIDGILMQFTGLRDKNGKEIYEGDILRTGISGFKTVVDYREGMFCFDPDEEGDRRHALMMILDPKYKVEVIGNIYENPELLNPVKN